jgi:hypothetical protein
VPDAASEQIPTENYEAFWAPFDARFDFRPNTCQHAGITEPTPSVTVDLAPVFAARQAEFAAVRDAVNALALLAMTRVFDPSERLLVLDWQHVSWWFRPHQQAVLEDQQWPVEVFPNGDYYIFLSEDMTSGTFGHPWQQTLCIFGELAPALGPMLTSWLPVKRSRQ